MSRYEYAFKIAGLDSLIAGLGERKDRELQAFAVRNCMEGRFHRG
jgi:hypothetical protein